MATKNDEPVTEAKHWLKLFDDTVGYKHEPSRFLEDYLDLTLCAVANKQRETRYLEVAKRYTREELETVSQLFAYHVLIHEHQTTPGADGKRGWYDLLGDIYMDLSGRSKTSRLGQFFTPESLCTMMAMMTLGDDATEGRTVCDPCAGSGRMLLAAKSVAPDLGTMYAADVDGICVKMCALNFWLHGVRAEVAHMNSLSQEWYGAYHVHPHKSWPFVTYLDDSRKEESHLYVAREQVFEQQMAKQTAPLPAMDLFSQAEEPAEPYGDYDDDPFKPCSQCGRDRSDTCMLLNGRIVEPWTVHGDDDPVLVCTGCGRELQHPYRGQQAEKESLVCDRKPLYGTQAKVQRYLDNDRRATLDRLMDLHVVLHRHKCLPDYTGMDKWAKEREDARVEEAFVAARKRLALELRLRNAELVHDSIKCRIGNMQCVFRFTSLPALIRSYRSNTKSAA